MAAQTITFEDVRIAVVTALKGVGIANVAVGQATMDNAINRAMIRVLSEAPIPEYSAGLYTIASLTVTTCVASYPADVLVPLAVDVAASKTVRKDLKETLRVETTGLPGTAEYVYTFAGNKVLIRPHVTPAILHYIAIPTALTSPTDAFPLGFALFYAVVLAAALTCATKMADIDPQQLTVIANQYQGAIGQLTGNTNKELVAGHLSQTARSALASGGGSQG